MPTSHLKSRCSFWALTILLACISPLRAAEPVQAIVLLNPGLAEAKPAVVDFFENNYLWFLAHSVGEPNGEFAPRPAKIDVEVGTLKTFKQGRYILEIGQRVPVRNGVDYLYPYALHYRDPKKSKTILLCQEAGIFAHWREPVPTQLPRLFNNMYPSSIKFFLMPAVMPAGGWRTEADLFASPTRANVPTAFPAKFAEKNGMFVSEAELHNRLPVKVAIIAQFAGDGFSLDAPACILEPGEKRVVTANTGVHLMRTVRTGSIFILDEELEAFKHK